MISRTAATTILVATLCGCGTIAPPPKYDRNIKPATSSHSSLTQYLDTIIKGGKLDSNWCKDRTLFATEFFTPTKFEILGAPDSDTFYSERSGGIGQATPFGFGPLTRGAFQLSMIGAFP